MLHIVDKPLIKAVGADFAESSKLRNEIMECFTPVRGINLVTDGMYIDSTRDVAGGCKTRPYIFNQDILCTQSIYQ